MHFLRFLCRDTNVRTEPVLEERLEIGVGLDAAIFHEVPHESWYRNGWVVCGGTQYQFDIQLTRVLSSSKRKPAPSSNILCPQSTAS